MSKNDTIKKIINQANSLNKKIKSFKDEKIDDHYDFISSMFHDEQMKFTDSGSLTKSKKFYQNQNILELKRTLNTLIKLNNHDVFGTVRKYKKFATEQWNTLKETVKNVLEKKGYSENDINMITSSKAFYNSLLIAFKEVKEGYGSDQVIEKVFLQYLNDEGKISDEQMNKVVSDIEYSVSMQRQLDEELRQYQDYLKFKEEIKRGKR